MNIPQLIGGQTPHNGPAFQFLKWLLAVFTERSAPKPVSKTRQWGAQRWTDNKWAKFLSECPGPWYLASGCRVEGLSLTIDHGSILLKWRTAALGPRFDFPPGQVTPLGCWGPHDLHLVFEAPGRPKLVSFGGDQADEWKLYNHSVFRPAHNQQALKEAMRRAHLCNGFVGTQWARPVPQGSLGVPWEERK